MNLHLMAYAVLLVTGTVGSGVSLDDKIKAFEDAVQAVPPLLISNGNFPMGHMMTVEDLDTVIDQGDNETGAEGIIAQLMVMHPSVDVQKSGDALIRALKGEAKLRADAFTAKANAVFAKVPDTLRQAKQASDLDPILKELQALQPQEGAFNSDATPDLAQKINASFQFVTQWQDYLSAMSRGNMQEAQNRLRMMLENRQITEPTFLPRSELLARMDDLQGGKLPASNPGPTSDVTDPDVILKKIRKPDDFQVFLADLLRVPGVNPQQPWDWSWLIALDKTRLDAVAGLPVTVDFKSVLTGQAWGDNISRIEAMELLAILPYYFGTIASDPPKDDETVSGYLERLSSTASAGGNLALLQRVIGVKVAMANPEGPLATQGTQRFLAGLSQDAAGQYAPAVISYEDSLKDPDSYLPVQIVGERLAAIKAAHPDEFEKGLSTFLNPPAPNYRLPYGYPPGFPPGFPPGMARYPGTSQSTVLPIPMTISIPARAVASPSPPVSGPVTNAPPVKPSTPPSTHNSD